MESGLTCSCTSLVASHCGMQKQMTSCSCDCHPGNSTKSSPAAQANECQPVSMSHVYWIPVGTQRIEFSDDKGRLLAYINRPYPGAQLRDEP